MSEVRRVPQEVSGVPDGVEMDAKCVYTKFFKDKMGQQTLNCSILASWENGVVSIHYTVGGTRQSIGVRLDEMIALLQEASAARQEQGGSISEQQKE